MASLWAVRLIGIIAIGYTVALTVGSLADPVEIKTSISNFDKVLHLSAYAGLAFLWLSYFQFLKAKRLRVLQYVRTYVLIAIAVIGYGIVIELLQGGTTDNRTPDFFDVLANTLGVALGTVVFVLFFKNIERLKSKN